MIKFLCKYCGQKINVEDKHSGRRGECPKCGKVFVVPDKSSIVEFHCKNCGQKISVPKIHAGKKGKCPKCKSIVVVPKTESASQVAIQAGLGSSEIAPKASGPDPRLFDMPQEMKAENQASSQHPVPDTTLEDMQRLREAMTIGTIKQEPRPERKLPWYIDILLYPTNNAGLTMIGIIVGVPFLFGLIFALIAFLTMIFPPLFILWPVLAFLGFIIGLLFGMYLYWYLCECVRDSADGGIRTPETIGQTPGLWELISQSWETFVCLVFFAFPVILYFTYTQRTDAIFWALLGFGVLLFPMGLLAVIMFDSISALNPVLIIGSILSAFFSYLGLILLIAALAFTIRFLVPMLALMFSGGNIIAIIGITVIYGSGIANFYFMMVIAHLLGRFYYQYQEKLNWEV